MQIHGAQNLFAQELCESSGSFEILHGQMMQSTKLCLLGTTTNLLVISSWNGSWFGHTDCSSAKFVEN